MARGRRRWVSQDGGSFHIISRVVGRQFLLRTREKNYFLGLMERLASGFFIHIHSFAILSNHFHILSTGMNQEARLASSEELLKRYRLIYGKDAEPPQGVRRGGLFIPDQDGGIERLRERLGSVSRFVQELKQGFSRWYNARNNRTGYFWGQRFKGVITYRGAAQFATSAYIDLNPVRAGIVESPEDYPWCSIGVRSKKPVRSAKWIHPITLLDVFEYSEMEWSLPYMPLTKKMTGLGWYRKFVHECGAVKCAGTESINEELQRQVILCNRNMGIYSGFRYRVKNFSEGLAVGGPNRIRVLQVKEKRKHINPRNFLDSYWSYTTRVLKC